MKEIYEKPCLFIEDFKISQTIASACFGVTRPNSDQYTCPVVSTDNILGTELKLFASAPSGQQTMCTDYAQDGDNGICYHASQDHLYQS